MEKEHSYSWLIIVGSMNNETYFYSLNMGKYQRVVAQAIFRASPAVLIRRPASSFKDCSPSLDEPDKTRF